MLQMLPTKRLPVPDPSQKMSGLLRPNVLPMTELFLGFVVPPNVVPRKYGSVETTTPPETAVGPEGTLPERWLPVTSIDVVRELGVARTGLDIEAVGRVSRVTYNVIVCESGVDAPAKDDRAGDIAYDAVSRNGSVAGVVKVEHERVPVWPRRLEAPDREAGDAHVLHARPGALAGIGVHVGEDADGL